jgi:calcineurin-like phosphoesterase family protein
MYIRISSDLHLEQYHNKEINTLATIMLPPDDRDADSVLVLAGDISSKRDQLIGFLHILENRFKHIIFVCGNHEWYKHEMVSYTDELLADSKNLHKTSMGIDGISTCIIDGIRYIYGTVWADGGDTLLDHRLVENGLWDFKIISVHNKTTATTRPFNVADMRAIHFKSVQTIKEILAESFDGKTVVVSHHLPSLKLCHPRFGNEINGGFASSLDDILEAPNAPNLWIAGHTHDTIDRQLGNTRVVVNPSGYRNEYHTAFNTYQNGPKFVTIESL